MSVGIGRFCSGNNNKPEKDKKDEVTKEDPVHKANPFNKKGVTNHGRTYHIRIRSGARG